MALVNSFWFISIESITAFCDWFRKFRLTIQVVAFILIDFALVICCHFCGLIFRVIVNHCASLVSLILSNGSEIDVRLNPLCSTVSLTLLSVIWNAAVAKPNDRSKTKTSRFLLRILHPKFFQLLRGRQFWHLSYLKCFSLAPVSISYFKTKSFSFNQN